MKKLIVILLLTMVSCQEKYCSDTYKLLVYEHFVETNQKEIPKGYFPPPLVGINYVECLKPKIDEKMRYRINLKIKEKKSEEYRGGFKLSDPGTLNSLLSCKKNVIITKDNIIRMY